MILGVVQEESPDLSVEEMLGMGVGETKRGRQSRNGYLSVGSIEEEDDEEEERMDLTAGMLLRAFWGTKKDLVGVLGSLAVLGLLAWRFVDTRHEDGASWLVFIVAAWVRFFLSRRRREPALTSALRPG